MKIKTFRNLAFLFLALFSYVLKAQVYIDYKVRTDDIYAETKEGGLLNGNADPVWHFRFQIGSSYNSGSWSSWECEYDIPGSQAYKNGAWLSLSTVERWTGTCLDNADNIYIGIEGWEDEDQNNCTYNSGTDNYHSSDTYDYDNDLSSHTRNSWTNFQKDDGSDDFVDCGTFGDDDFFKIEFDVWWNYSIPVDPTFAITDTEGNSFRINKTGDNNYRITNWDYQVSSDASFTNVVASGTEITASYVDVTGLSPNTTYYIRIRGENEAGTGSYTSYQTETTLNTPIVTTTSVSSITGNSASGGGDVTDEGGSSVTARGICWSTSTSPTTDDSKTTDGTGTGSFTSSLTALSSTTTYYVRAYATNSIGTSYGNEVSFTTATTATVTTSAISSVTTYSASSGGNISDNGGVSITERGVCWSTSTNPTINDSKSSDGTGSGSFTSEITNITSGTTYYVRAYATNSVGTSYGNEVSFISKYHNALDFDGTDDNVSIPDDNTLDMTSSYTLEAWIYPRSFSFLAGIISKYPAGSSGPSYVLRVGRTSPYAGIDFDNLGTDVDILSANTWYHIAAVKDGNDRYLYINGIQQSLSGTAHTTTANSSDITIGLDWSARYFDGYIDDVRIWDDARTAEEIREYMCRSLEGNESNLVAYYDFDTTSGTTLPDVTSNGNDGTWSGVSGGSNTSPEWTSSTAFNTWTGTSSTDWNTSSNWSQGSIPSSTDNVGINNLGGSSPVLPSNTSVNNLVIGSSVSATVSEGNSLTVNGNLFVNGSLTVASSSVDPSGTGSLITNRNTTGDVTVERYLDGGSGGYYHYISSPISNATAASLNADYNIYEWDEANNEWNRIMLSANLTPGQGYAAAFSSSKTLSFTGELNSGDVSMSVTASSVKYNILGNPYPSRIDANAFITDTDNSEISGTLYFWSDDHSQGSTYSTADYATWNSTGSAQANSAQPPTQYIESGQGFAVLASSAGEVIFKNSHRVHSAPGQFHAGQTEEKQRIWLELTNEYGISNQILIGFLEEATKGEDRLYDGIKNRGNEYIAFYSLIADHDGNYIIQGLPAIEAETEVELGYFASEAIDHTIKIDKIENLSGYEITLIDKKKNKTIDLLSQSYEFSSIAGEENDRFVLKIAEPSNSISEENESLIFYSKNDKIHIHGLKSECKVTIYDILGNLIQEDKAIGTFESRLLTTNTFYVVFVTKANHTEVRKMLIN